MTILFKYLIYFVSAVFTGKLIFIQHVIFRYNRILQQVSESYFEAFSIASKDSLLLF